MSSRKNKVLIIFALMIITMNIFALTQIKGISNDQNETTLPSMEVNNQPEINDPITVSQFNDSNLPSLSLWDLEINVTHTVTLHDFGYMQVTDLFKITKNDNITMPIFRFALPREWSCNLIYLYAESMYETSSKRNQTEAYQEYENEYYTFYAIDLIPAITNSSLYEILIVATILRPDYNIGFTVFESLGYNTYYVNFSLIPMIPAELDFCRTTFIWDEEMGLIDSSFFPSNASAQSSSVIYGNIYDIASFNFSFPYNLDATDYPYHGRIGIRVGQSPPLEALNYKRTITLENWYWAEVKEEITFKSFGYEVDGNQFRFDLLNRQYFFTFALRFIYLWMNNTIEDSYKVYDELGLLTAESQENPIWQKNRLSIHLRSPLNGGAEKTVTVEYRMFLEDILKFDKTEYILETVALPECDFHIRNFESQIILPQGARFQYITLGSENIAHTQSYTTVLLRIGRRQVIEYSLTNLSTSYSIVSTSGVDYHRDITLRVSYYMSDLTYFIQPMIFALVIFIACLIYIGVRVLRKDVLDKVIISTEVVEEVPIELIQNFVEKYEEKTALQSRISTLDENRRKKKVKQKEYDRQRKILEAKMRELIRELDTTKRKLKEKGRKYFSIIQKIEVSEEKRTSVERSIQDLKIRYIREKQISKEAYLRILRDYQNQIEKFDRDIDREIINLRLLIEHESK